MNDSLERQLDDFAKGFGSSIAAIAPIFMLVVILGIAFSNGFLEYKYQNAIIGDYALFIGVVFAAFRFGSGLGGVSMMKKREYIRGIFFFSASLALTFYAWFHVENYALFVAKTKADAPHAVPIVTAILWGGFLAELMFAAYMLSGDKQPATKSETDDATDDATDIETAISKSATFHSNGNATIHRNVSTNGNGLRNETLQPQNTIGFKMPQRKEYETEEKPRNIVSNGLSEDYYLLSEELRKAQAKVRSYRSKLNRNDGNPETNKRGLKTWKKEVQRLEEQLQNATFK